MLWPLQHLHKTTRDRELGQRYDQSTSSLCNYIPLMFQLVSKIVNLCWQLEKNALLSVSL